jgi:hypothetical protein
MFLLTTVIAAASCAGTFEPASTAPQGSVARAAGIPAPDPHADEQRIVPLPDTAVTASERYQCGDTVMSDQLTSGGERMVSSVPCWDTGEERIAHEEYIAQLAQERAEDQKQSHAYLADDEQAACRGMSPRELEHSPFAHRKEIAEVLPHRNAGTLRGVRIIWKPVPGLTAAWMRQAIACHRARFERLGEPAIYLPEDPTLVARATVTVEQRKGHLEVLIETADDTAGQVALDRAQDLVRPRTAGR